MHMIRSTPVRLTQAAVNLSLASWDKELILSRLTARGTKVTEVLDFANSVEANVRTVSMHYLVATSASKTEFWQSQFFVVLPEKDAAFFTVACLAPQSEQGPEFQRAMSAIRSLKFQSRAE